MLGYESQESKKEGRFYMRYHQTIRRAMDFNKELYGDKKGKDGKQFKWEHPIRVAGMTEEIQEQSLFEYHLNWLVGILHDAKEDDPILYSEKIDEILKDLLQEEKDLTKTYIDQLSKDRTLPKGQQKKEHVQRMSKLDLVPSYIKIFDKYDNCRRFLNNPVGKSSEELNGYHAVAILCYDIANKTHSDIRKYLNPGIKKFFESLRARLGGNDKINEYAKRYYERE